MTFYWRILLFIVRYVMIKGAALSSSKNIISRENSFCEKPFNGFSTFSAIALALLLSSCAIEKKSSNNSRSSKASASLNKTSKHINNKTKFSSKEFGVKGSPRVSSSKKVRKGGGRYQIGKPYTIRGKRYYPKENKRLNQVGMASWYGPNFHGRLTANGEVYDQYSLSAAHPTLPLPSYAKVTNVSNGRSVIVRVNDRGPYAHGRVIDLSAKAAELLDYANKGVTKVRVQYHGKARMDGLDEKFLLASYQGPGAQGIHRTLDPFGRPAGKSTNNNSSTMIAMVPVPTAAPIPEQSIVSISPGVALAPTPQSAINASFKPSTSGASGPLSILPVSGLSTTFQARPSNGNSPVYQVRHKPLAYAALDNGVPSFDLFDIQFKSVRPYLGQNPNGIVRIELGEFIDANVKHELTSIFGIAGEIVLFGKRNTAQIVTTEQFANSILAYARVNGILHPFAH